MNVKAVIPLVAGLGIGGVALKLGINTLKHARAGQPAATHVTLWAAKEEIPRGSEIREELLQPMEFPTELVPPGAFSDKDKLVGRMPRIVAPAGLPVLDSMLSPPGSSPGINPQPGYRAVAVTIDAGSGVDYHLEPGCFVDVVGSLRVRNEMTAKMIVENAEVAAVGPRVSPATGSKVEEGKEKTQTVRAVTLYVRPDDVKRILLTEQQGRIKLSLRGNDDKEIIKDESVVTESELTGTQPEKPALAATGTDAASFLKNLVAPKPPPPEPPALVTAPLKPEVQPWITRVHRGEKTQQFQFRNRDSCEQVDGPAPESGGKGKPLPAAPRPAPANPPAAPENPPPAQPAANEPPPSNPPQTDDAESRPASQPSPAADPAVPSPVRQTPAEGSPESEEPLQ